MTSWPVLILFHFIVAILLAIDLFAGYKRKRAMKFKDALKWSILWISFGIIFGLGLITIYPFHDIADYFTVFLLEESLSMDNLFVFFAIFTYFATPLVARRIALYVGIITAIVFRALFIYTGIKVIEIFPWVVFLFGILLFYTGLRFWKSEIKSSKIEKNPILKLTKHYLPIASRYKGSKIILSKAPLLLSPLVLVIITIETTDLMFAIDSIPAALAISKKFLIVYTANISAVLGLRSLYFLIQHMFFRFKYLSKSLALVLAFLGLKFLLDGIGIELPKAHVLAFTWSIIALGIFISMLKKLKIKITFP